MGTLRWSEVGLWFRANEVAVLGFIACASATAMVVGIIFHQISWIPCATAILIAVLWVVTAAMAFEAHGREAKYAVSQVFDRRWLRSVQIATIMMPLSLAFVAAPAWGIRFSPETGATTVDHSIIIAVPLWHSVVFVREAYRPIVSVRISTRDGIPLRCTVWASGIEMDWRDRERLKRFVLEAIPVSDPGGYVADVLQTALKREATAVLSEKTSDDISRQEGFAIPYRIGTPLGNTLHALLLHWNGGEVSFSCKVTFDNPR